MSSVDGHLDYKRREYCNDVKCPVQLLLNKEGEKSPKYEQIRAICTSNCIRSAYEFHHWLTKKGYLVVRPKRE